VSNDNGLALDSSEVEEEAFDKFLLASESPKYEKRKKVFHQGRQIYEWEQDLEEINLWIDPPPGLKADQIECTIKATHLTVGIKGNPPYLDKDLTGSVVEKESFWTFEDNRIHIQMQKSLMGETWPCIIDGHGELNPVEAQQVQQKILLERFQRENPGFDFSQAQFNGSAPDARKFLGGIDRNRLS